MEGGLTIDLFVDEADGIEGVGLVIRDSSIVEYEGELVPGCKLSPGQARDLAVALIRFADQIYMTE